MKNEFRAMVNRTGITILSLPQLGVHFDSDVGLDTMDLEAMTDYLSDGGWQLDSPWKLASGASARQVYQASVSRLPAREYEAGEADLRRADIALALVEEDKRAGTSGPLLDRVQYAVDFEDMMRDRGDFKHGS